MDLLVSRFCKSRSSRLAPTKLVPLSERVVEGQPLLSVNQESAARNASEVRSDTSSMCTALEVQQINKQAYDSSRHMTQYCIAVNINRPVVNLAEAGL